MKRYITVRIEIPNRLKEEQDLVKVVSKLLRKRVKYEFIDYEPIGEVKKAQQFIT